MRPSLEALGRYDGSRVRRRFLDSFVPEETVKLVSVGEVIGFYVVRDREDHIYLDHLYIDPKHQNKQLGKGVLERVIAYATSQGKPVKLGALRGSRANEFYLKHGFRKTHEDEFDIYYQFSIHS